MRSWARAVPFRSGAEHESLPAFAFPIGRVGKAL